MLNLAFLDRTQTLNEIIAQCLYRHVEYGTAIRSYPGECRAGWCLIEEECNGMMPLKPSEVDLMCKQADGSKLPAVSINTSGTVQAATHTHIQRETKAQASWITGGIK